MKMQNDLVANSITLPRSVILEFFAFWIVLLATLQSYYFYSIHLSPMPVLAGAITLLVVFIRGDIKFRPASLIFLFTFSLVFFVGIVVNFVSGLATYWSTVIGVFFGLSIFVAFSSSYSNFGNFVVVAGEKVIKIHVSVFFFQLLIWLVVGKYIDLLAPVTGETQRNLISGLSFIRACGLFNEPATLSAFLGYLLLISNDFRRPIRWLEIIAISAMCISFSMSGIMLAGIYITLRLYCSHSWRLAFMFFAIFTIAVASLLFFSDAFSSYVLDRLGEIFTGNDSSANVRLSSFSFFWDGDVMQRLFGLGLGSYPNGASLALSVYSFVFNEVGIVGGTLFFTSLFSGLYLAGVRILELGFLVFLFFSSAVVPTNVMFWLVLSALLVTRGMRKYGKSGVIRFLDDANGIRS